MSHFFRLSSEDDKAQALAEVCANLRQGVVDARWFEVAPESFDAVPGKPFAYWVSETVRRVFRESSSFEGNGRAVRQGLATADDFRFLRAYWESSGPGWIGFAKGGAFSPFFADIHLAVNWRDDGRELDAFSGSVIRNPGYYLRAGLTWPLRTNGLSFRAMPRNCIFGHKGPAAFVADNDPKVLLALLALANSQAFGALVAVQLARTELAQSFEVGLIQQTPVPDLSEDQTLRLASLARRAWSLKRTISTTEETSHTFLLPALLRPRLGDFDPAAIASELADIQTEIDAIAFDLFAFSPADRETAGAQNCTEDNEAGDDEDNEDAPVAAPRTDALLSWAVGVAFGRWDWRLATGEQPMPLEPEPFDPLPDRSPGMLIDGVAPFHTHSGILVDDPGHAHDLARLIEDALATVGATPPVDARGWLQRDFFAFHLQRYSKSRRKAPIYWPLSTMSGSYTLWIYYPSLSSQILYTAINDFVELKLKQVDDDITTLRNKGSARTRDDEKQFEAVQAFELELVELRDILLKLALTYKPNHDDGVQITAAPLWPLFRHKPWQKLLKDTWAKLEKGDYDWAHLAMAYWPDRVREKCQTDKSLAIAHGLEHLYVEPEVTPKKSRGRKKADT
ncbi:type II restriction endonuclease subunit M [Burkholderia ambifaria]|uniref:type II restriction endonuclease subunit M n=1 Tax=Burkholderia ambifaria TaxID=152480 RepID=UPI00158BB3DF|nr:type II restriction endonuclease subunit M [Burkholderia ambifaria]